MLFLKPSSKMLIGMIEAPTMHGSTPAQPPEAFQLVKSTWAFVTEPTDTNPVEVAEMMSACEFVVKKKRRKKPKKAADRFMGYASLELVLRKITVVWIERLLKIIARLRAKAVPGA